MQRHRDYIAKRLQYQDWAIPEYWIIDPQRSTILVLALAGDRYSEWGTFQGSDAIESPQFKLLNFTSDQIFAAIR